MSSPMISGEENGDLFERPHPDLMKSPTVSVGFTPARPVTTRNASTLRAQVLVRVPMASGERRASAGPAGREWVGRVPVAPAVDWGRAWSSSPHGCVTLSGPGARHV